MLTHRDESCARSDFTVGPRARADARQAAVRVCAKGPRPLPVPEACIYSATVVAVLPGL